MTAGVIVFARHPEAGKVKTRLAPMLGNIGAAELYECLLVDTLAQCRSDDWQCVVAVEPEAQCALMSRRFGSDFTYQGQAAHADLGARLYDAFEHAPKSWDRVVIVGSDAVCPLHDRLGDAISMLGSHSLVLGPALDGGYYLIGLRRDASDLATAVFTDMPWSTPTLFSETLRRAGNVGVTPVNLPPARDIDLPEDLIALADRSEWSQWLPCTAAWLATHGSDRG